jgi:hypothetical protein
MWCLGVPCARSASSSSRAPSSWAHAVNATSSLLRTSSGSARVAAARGVCALGTADRPGDRVLAAQMLRGAPHRLGVRHCGLRVLVKVLVLGRRVVQSDGDEARSILGRDGGGALGFPWIQLALCGLGPAECFARRAQAVLVLAQLGEHRGKVEVGVGAVVGGQLPLLVQVVSLIETASRSASGPAMYPCN